MSKSQKHFSAFSRGEIAENGFKMAYSSEALLSPNEQHSSIEACITAASSAVEAELDVAFGLVVDLPELQGQKYQDELVPLRRSPCAS